MKKKLFRERRKKDIFTIKKDKYFNVVIDDIDIKKEKPKKKKKAEK